MELRPEVFTADYVGEPGERTFYLQVRDAGSVSSYLVEKEQVAVLAEKVRELLIAVDRQDTVLTATPARDPALSLTEPVEPEWRAGAMGLSYDEDDEQVVIFLRQSQGGESEEEEDIDAFDVRLFLRRDQARAFVLHAIAVVAEGRPLCQLCGLPMDPEGHICPASNGHRRSS